MPDRKKKKGFFPTYSDISAAMDIFNNLPDELKREVMSYTRDLCDATPRQLRFFI